MKQPDTKLIGLGTLVALAFSILAPQAMAQKYPDHTVTWVVPFGPGTVTDNGARVVAKALTEKLGQPVIVENRPGAGGIVGTEFVANAKPDGYTMLYGSSGPMATNPSLYKKLSYSPLKSFVPVYSIGESPLVVVVNADSPFKTLADLIDYGKKNPGKLNFGTSGAGTAQHLTGELLQMAAGIKMTHIPYKAGASQMVDLLAGVLQVNFEYPSVVKPQIAAGKLRPLGVTSAKPLNSFPGVKTVAEQGWPDVVLTAWATLMLPAGTPLDVVNTLATAFAAALQDPEVVKYYADNDTTLLGLGPDKLPAFMESEAQKFKRIVDTAKIEVN